ncbi:hypothetical protein [Aureitalea marina]|uniref:hypothetical protein n=1 Tax=Aureitalea marina TaxID=930804 RepID=UPI0011B08401|nr:hypothetical protein [Aureitalea marina]
MRNLRCKLIGHDLEFIRMDQHKMKEYRCRCCKAEFTEDGNGMIVRLNKHWQENNRLFQELVSS